MVFSLFCATGTGGVSPAAPPNCFSRLRFFVSVIVCCLEYSHVLRPPINEN